MMRMRAVWVAVGLLGATALGLVAASRGEHVNAMWLLTAAVCVYVLAFRFYSRFIADRVLGLDPKRPTPAVACNDGLDFVPTNKYVLFGHHFAAIAGAGPLVGPILASQLGYLPGVLWIVIGAVAAGAVQDFIILALSMRRGGRSLGEMVREEMGLVPGLIAQVGTFVIMIIILAVLALIVVKALAHSPWGASTVAATIPIALLMGLYMRFVRPGRIAEVSIAGFRLADPGCLERTLHIDRSISRLAVHLDRAAVVLGADSVRRGRLHPARLAVARAARLSLDLHENRRDRVAGARGVHRPA